MKSSNKRELQRLTYNHSSDIDFKDFMNIYKNVTTKPCYCFVNYSTIESDNHLRFRRKNDNGN